MSKHVFIDESGDLGKFGSKYFAIAAVVVDEPKTLGRIIKKLRQRKLKKTIKKLPEIKANNSNRIIREYVLKKVKDTDCRIFSIVIKKDSVVDYLFDAKDKLYNYLCGVLLSKINMDESKLIIIIDKKHTNTLIRKDFDEYIKKKLKAGGKEAEIYHKYSHTSNELQVVDFIVWSINRKFNAGDNSYYRIFEEKIINKEDMLVWEHQK